MEYGADLEIPDADGYRPSQVYLGAGPQITATVRKWMRKRTGEEAPMDEKKCNFHVIQHVIALLNAKVCHLSLSSEVVVCVRVVGVGVGPDEWGSGDDLDGVDETSGEHDLTGEEKREGEGGRVGIDEKKPPTSSGEKEGYHPAVWRPMSESFDPIKQGKEGKEENGLGEGEKVGEKDWEAKRTQSELSQGGFESKVINQLRCWLRKRWAKADKGLTGFNQTLADSMALSHKIHSDLQARASKMKKDMESADHIFESQIDKAERVMTGQNNASSVFSSAAGSGQGYRFIPSPIPSMVSTMEEREPMVPPQTSSVSPRPFLLDRTMNGAGGTAAVPLTPHRHLGSNNPNIFASMTHLGGRREIQFPLQLMSTNHDQAGARPLLEGDQNPVMRAASPPVVVEEVLVGALDAPPVEIEILDETKDHQTIEVTDHLLMDGHLQVKDHPWVEDPLPEEEMIH
ncbi:hypothetical protein JAAARDRAFT_199658 [Jaapia argillacea MUCL 33604]|uniref:Uncharacterized protein n=1 Tax=Jaapia argillacea MUCL 33604 TaxID=933084 RepID=A0A067P7D6_9AGAM|nr:hypothetical protein JAAARDRAFT_199658 [Jaapia argillacea MUCL 33604]